MSYIENALDKLETTLALKRVVSAHPRRTTPAQSATKPAYGFMTRTHVRLMFEQSGHATALRVLTGRKARPEFFVYLEQLRIEKIRSDARAIAAQAA